MSVTTIKGLSIAYEVIGAAGRSWVLTPGGRLGRDVVGIQRLAEELAQRRNRVLIWDRPNCGESDVCFTGPSETAMNADVLAELLERLNMAPAILCGGSAGARLALATASQHPSVVCGLGVWWVSGGVYGLNFLAHLYCSASINAAWNGGMEAVVALPEWQGVIQRNPANRPRFLAQDPKQFIATLERWMLSFCPCDDNLAVGIPEPNLRELRLPVLIFRNGESDMNHTRATSDKLAEVLPDARVVDPPWPDTEWIDRRAAGEEGFVRWPRLAPSLQEWADEVFR